MEADESEDDSITGNLMNYILVPSMYLVHCNSYNIYKNCFLLGSIAPDHDEADVKKGKKNKKRKYEGKYTYIWFFFTYTSNTTTM